MKEELRKAWLLYLLKIKEQAQLALLTRKAALSFQPRWSESRHIGRFVAVGWRKG
jgi:hypothetical protein